MKKLLFVINPNAGKRKAAKHLPEIIDIFNREDYLVCTYFTAAQDDARKVVAQKAAEMDMVVCCGGDGTFNETVAGVLESGADVPLGYIPAGSTNDFANSLGLSTNPVEAARRIATGVPECYDVGCFGGRYFTYVASFGAFTKSSYATPQSVKNALGHTAYVLSGIQEISQLRKIHVKLETEEETLEGDYIFGAICNSTSIGGILKLDPSQVDLADGLLEVLLVRVPKDVGELTACVQAVQKHTYDCAMMTFRSVKKVTVYADEEIAWTLDGEKEIGKPEVLVENIHHAIRLMK